MPSWDLKNWGMTKKQVNEMQKQMNQKNVKQAFEEKYGDDVFKTENMLKIQDEELRKEIIKTQGRELEQYVSRYDIYLIEQNDKEFDSSLIAFYMMDKKTGKIKQMNNVKFGENDTKEAFYGKNSKKRGIANWELDNNSKLIAYKDQDGKLSLAQEKDDELYFTKTQDMINNEEKIER